MDHVSPERRSENMRRIRGKNTAPELAVRRYLHGLGFRFRLHRRDLPGCPDLVFPSRRTCLFVQGCFWHGCPKCRTGARVVKSNASYWTPKITRNKERDAATRDLLRAEGWQVIDLWECEVRDSDALAAVAAELSKMAPYKARLGA
jgi:DNA mismatch endonuclease (patch repair protein)